jgi:hypothetical protein
MAPKKGIPIGAVSEAIGHFLARFNTFTRLICLTDLSD